MESIAFLKELELSKIMKMEENKSKLKNLKSYLTFQMSGETFAVKVLHVQNILEQSRVTEIPTMPDFFLGVVNLRGTVLPLIDPRKKLGLTIHENTINTCILVLENTIEGQLIQLGILVDKVEEVLEIEEDMIQFAKSKRNGIDERFIRGLYKYHNDSFIIILNADEFFHVDGLSKTSTLSEKTSTLKP